MPFLWSTRWIYDWEGFPVVKGSGRRRSRETGDTAYLEPCCIQRGAEAELLRSLLPLVSGKKEKPLCHLFDREAFYMGKFAALQFHSLLKLFQAVQLGEAVFHDVPLYLWIVQGKEVSEIIGRTPPAPHMLEVFVVDEEGRSQLLLGADAA